MSARVSKKLWRRACLWVARSRNDVDVQTNPRTEGFCAGYLAAMRDQAKKRQQSLEGFRSLGTVHLVRNSKQKDLFS